MENDKILYAITNEASYPDSDYHDILMVVDSEEKAKEAVIALSKNFIEEEIGDDSIFKGFVLEDGSDRTLPNISLYDKSHSYYERWATEIVYLNPKEYIKSLAPINYQLNDTVYFKFGRTELVGKVICIHQYEISSKQKEPVYDISINHNEDFLTYKNIKQSDIIDKL